MTGSVGLMQDNVKAMGLRRNYRILDEYNGAGAAPCLTMYLTYKWTRLLSPHHCRRKHGDRLSDSKWNVILVARMKVIGAWKTCTELTEFYWNDGRKHDSYRLHLSHIPQVSFLPAKKITILWKEICFSDQSDVVRLSFCQYVWFQLQLLWQT